MGYSIVEKYVRGKVSTWRKFIADTVDDIATLPVVPEVASGSECYCSENGATYVLETDSDWVIKQKGSGGGSSSLPEVTNEDNGDILTVVNGEWNKAGSDVYVIHFYEDEETNKFITVETGQEIFDALLSGNFNQVYLVTKGDGQYEFEKWAWGSCFPIISWETGDYKGDEQQGTDDNKYLRFDAVGCSLNYDSEQHSAYAGFIEYFCDVSNEDINNENGVILTSSGYWKTVELIQD